MQDISQLKDHIVALYERHRGVQEGTVATYIPELGKANPEHFGISLATVGGQEFSIGDWGQEFTIQSICKPLAFLMQRRPALQQCFCIIILWVTQYICCVALLHNFPFIHHHYFIRYICHQAQVMRYQQHTHTILLLQFFDQF